jgi:hypothetical protein
MACIESIQVAKRRAKDLISDTRYWYARMLNTSLPLYAFLSFIWSGIL